jgi:hypothetical protein
MLLVHLFSMNERRCEHKFKIGELVFLDSKKIRYDKVGKEKVKLFHQVNHDLF